MKQGSRVAHPRRWVVVFGLVSVAALAALATIAVRMSADAAEEQARRQVASSAAASAVAVEREMTGIADVVASFATRPTLVAALSQRGGAIDHAVLRFHLEALKDSRSQIGLAFVAAPDGILLDILPETPSIVGDDFSHRDWYRGVLETGGAYVSEVYETKAAGGGFVVGVAAPIRAVSDPAGRLLGILVAGYHLSSIQGFVDVFAQADGVDLTVTDQRGVHVASPGGPSTALISRLDDAAVAAALRGEAGTIDASREGRDYFTAYAPIDALGWTLVAEVRRSAALSGWSGIWTGVVTVTIALSLILLIALFFVDRSLRRRAVVDEELRRSQAFLDTVIENIPSSVFVKDPTDLRFIRMNRAGAAMLGYEPHDFIGRTTAEIVGGGDQGAFSEASDRDVLERGEILDIPDQRVDHRDGEEVIFHTRKIPILDEAGRPLYLLGIAEDVTVAHRASEEIKHAREVADSSNRAKSEFLSRMSHELRTPLNAVLGFGQLLQLEPLSPSQRTSIDHIVSAGRHLLALIDEVLDISRVETGELRLSVEPVSVSEVVTQAVGMMQPLADARGLRVVVEWETLDGRYVAADRQRLKQVLVNLMANAVKYNRDDGEVGVRCEPLPDGELQLIVSDTGIGIPEGDLGRLFVPFERLAATDTEIEGTGLGLTLTKQLVEAMAGRIGVTSRLGVGSAFRVDLPLVDPPSARSDELPTLKSGAPASSGPRTILYIEDNVANVKLLEQIVATRPQVTLLVAMHGRLGLELAREHRPSLVLLDLHLPDMPGEEVLHRLRADPATSRAPIFVLSADATPGRVDRLIASGATGYLTKPFDVSHLLHVIDGVPPALEDRAARPDPEGALDDSVVRSLHDLATMSPAGPSGLRDLVEVYIADARDRMVELGRAARTGDSARLTALAHSLAGSSANLGASALAAACRRLEADAAHLSVENAIGAAAKVATLFEAACRSLQSEFLDTDEVVAR